MSGESKICEVDECENQVQVTVTQETASKQRNVCHECVMTVMLMMKAEE